MSTTNRSDASARAVPPMISTTAIAQHARRIVDEAEAIYADEDTYEAAQLLYAARVFMHALEVFEVGRECDARRKASK